MKTVAELEALVYAPGQWKCRKCNFVLLQQYLHMPSGKVSIKSSDPNEDCPNGCGAKLEPVTERECAIELGERLEEAHRRIKELEAQLEGRTAQMH